MQSYKILFASMPAEGHFNPLTGLALHLKKMGHDVRWYTGRSYKEKVIRLNIPFYPFKKAFEANVDYLDQIFPERTKYKSQVAKLRFDLKNLFIQRSTEYYEDVCEIYQNFPFDILITEPGFTAIPMVKDHLAVPVITVGVVPLMESSADLAPYGLGLPPSNTFWGRRKQDLMRWYTNTFVFGESNRLMKKILKKYKIKTQSKSVFDLAIEKSDYFLQSGTPGFEYNRKDLSGNIRFIGPVLPAYTRKIVPLGLEEKLKKYPRVILVTQGTAEKDTEKLIVPTLEAFKDSDYLVIATTGGVKTKELKEWYNYDNVIVEDYIPFQEIMPHVDVFITNGGYGGVMLSIENKVPMLVAGVHEGKNEINARVEFFKVGVNLKTETPSVKEIKNGVREIFDNPVYKSNVLKLSEEFREYTPNILTACYVNELLNIDTKKVKLNGFLKLEEQNQLWRKLA